MRHLPERITVWRPAKKTQSKLCIMGQLSLERSASVRQLRNEGAACSTKRRDEKPTQKMRAVKATTRSEPGNRGEQSRSRSPAFISGVPVPACEIAVRFSELAVFNASLYVQVRRLDEPAERCGICVCFRSQLHVAHELAGSFQQASRVRQRCAVKEPHVDVRSEYIDVAERRIAYACNRTYVMQELADFIAAFAHRLKPHLSDGAQFSSMLPHPGIDGGIAFDSTAKSQQLCSHLSFVFAFGSIVSGTQLVEERRRDRLVQMPMLQERGRVSQLVQPATTG